MPQDSAQQAQHLEQAFNAFNQMSVQLESSYRELENQVGALNQELAAARSERLKQLAEKEKLADRLEQLLELLPGGVLVLSENNTVTQTNPMAESLLEKGLPGKHWNEIVARHFKQHDRDCGEVLLANGRFVSISTRPLGNESGRIVLMMDVSDQHELKLMLERQDRLALMGEMLASLAHQIRTPLTTALLYASQMKNVTIHEVERERMSGKIVDRLRHLEHMVNDMLRYTRGDAIVPQVIKLAALVDEFRQVIEPQLEQNHGRIYISDIDSALEIQGDHKALLGVLLNLANNAIEIISHGVALDLSISQIDDGKVRLLFSDNGPGIEADIKDKIFTPFFTTRTDGTGLGLAVVQATMHAHKGEIRLLESPGACFEMLLPLAGNFSLLPSGWEDEAAQESKQADLNRV